MRYRMRVEYDGTDFHGWQVQPNQSTIQETIEGALEVVLKHRPTLTGSGRTDAGVHAFGQMAHFDSDAEIEPDKLRGNLNGLLPKTIAILDVQQATPEFHARYDAIARCYQYYLATLPVALQRNRRVFIRPAPDFDKMNEAANILLGQHHFGSFCRTQSETQNRVCTIAHARWHEEEETGYWYFRIEADRFLHGMVRAIVGTLLQIGQGSRKAEDLPSILAAQDRTAAGPAAPAHGLVLHHVTYPETD